MTTNEIPEAAYEAATRAEWEHWGPSWHTLTYETDVDHREYLRSQIERAVDAAAPFLKAQALRDAAEALQAGVSRANPTSAKAWIRAGVAAELRDHADELDPS